MDRFNALGRGAQLMLIGGVLLFIDLFLPWQDFGNEFSDAVGVDASFSGWRGFGGVLVGLLTIVLLAWVIVRLVSVHIPLTTSTAMTAAITTRSAWIAPRWGTTRCGKPSPEPF